jgi:hypothetical protein
MFIPLAPASIQGKVAIIFQLTFGVWMTCHLTNILNSAATVTVTPLIKACSFSYTLYVLHFPILLFGYGVLETAAGVSYISAFGSLAIAIGISALIGPRLERIKIIN